MMGVDHIKPDRPAFFQKVDNRSSEAAIYLNGNQAFKRGIWLGNSFGSIGASSIIYRYSGLGQGNCYNESMSVTDNGNMLGLEPMGMSHLLRTEKKPLTNEGTAQNITGLCSLSQCGASNRKMHTLSRKKRHLIALTWLCVCVCGKCWIGNWLIANDQARAIIPAAL
jgi:hypothetical protein